MLATLLALAALTTPAEAWGAPRFDLDCRIAKGAAAATTLRISVDLESRVWRIGADGEPRAIKDLHGDTIVFDDDGARRIRRFMAVDRETMHLVNFVNGYGTGSEAACALAAYTPPARAE